MLNRIRNEPALLVAIILAAVNWLDGIVDRAA